VSWIRESLSLRVSESQLLCLDQTLLPHQEVWQEGTHPDQMEALIQNLQVRGAPLIGVAAVLCLGLFAQKQNPSEEEFRRQALRLRESRPTAVNLMRAIDRLLEKSSDGAAALFAEALEIFDEDVALCAAIGKNGAELIVDGEGVLTHCNTGGLATVGMGTALGVITTSFTQGKKIHVYVDETRPLLQGGRLNTWELEKAKVPYTLICDNMAGFLMSKGKVQKVIVGADRIAMNGDFANKVGTYSLAVLCKHHGIPFYTAAPATTLDPDCESGSNIPVEERAADEVRRDWAPKSAPVWNPAFDVTPAELVSGWILDKEVVSFEDVQKGRLKELV